MHSLLKSAFNSIAIEKEKLKQIVSEQDLTGHNAQIAHLRQSLSQVCSWFDLKHIYLAQCTVSFVFWPFPFTAKEPRKSQVLSQNYGIFCYDVNLTSLHVEVKDIICVSTYLLWFSKVKKKDFYTNAKCLSWSCSRTAKEIVLVL